jgi:hypothetical protein
MTSGRHISGTRPDGYEAADGESVRIPYNTTPEDHADIRRKLATGWVIGEIHGDERSLFKYVQMYPPR